MLKSLGLWKESTPEIELREDMEYPLNPEDTKLVVEGRINEVGRKYVKMHDQTGPWVCFYILIKVLLITSLKQDIFPFM